MDNLCGYLWLHINRTVSLANNTSNTVYACNTPACFVHQTSCSSALCTNVELMLLSWGILEGQYLDTVHANSVMQTRG